MILHTFTALPKTPEKLQPLLEMAGNLWFSWNWDAVRLFASLDNEIWHKSQKNPIKMLCEISQDKLEAAAKDESYIADVDAVYTSFKKYLNSKTWFEEQHGKKDQGTVAYFSCEFGIHESLPIYSGGLGVLAGDHMKSASDLGVPLVGVGFLYRQGYFRQGLNADGIQQEFYPENDWFHMPVTLVKDKILDRPVLISVQIGPDEIFAQIWKVMVGRNPLYLMDTNIVENHPQHRDITKRLYDSNREMRLKQEILLGIGGVRVLKALGYSPKAYHINEGHSAFLILERIRSLIEERKLTCEEAKEVVWASNIFTTHTPVPAGNERFDVNMLKNFLGGFVQKGLGLSWSQFLELGLEDPSDVNEDFCLTVLALKCSSMANGVARLHGEVSRDMWKNLYPQLPVHEVPIGHITNGVHTKTWLSKNYEQLFARYIETAYVREIADFTIWRLVDKIPDKELWHAHCERKKDLIDYARKRIKFQMKRRGAGAGELQKVESILNPDALTIGFARRFAPYKRGHLFLKQVERLLEICCDPDRPVQFIFAGKAHPADEDGKEIIKTIIEASNDPELSSSIVFLEDYDIDMAKHLVQGVDVWLNNPRRPLEASGTSGMKAAMNGAINLSVLDGWWDEAYDTTNGWSIGGDESYPDLDYQDEVEANLLYHLIEDEVAPLYYNIDEDGYSSGWLKMMKRSIKTCGGVYNANRMVTDYLSNYYLKAEKNHETLLANECAIAKDLAAWRHRLEVSWHDTRIVEVSVPDQKAVIYSGSAVDVFATIHLGTIAPEDVTVEVYHGSIGLDDNLSDTDRHLMQMVESNGTGAYKYRSAIPCSRGGRYGYTVRIIPGHKHLAEMMIPKLIRWER